MGITALRGWECFKFRPPPRREAFWGLAAIVTLISAAEALKERCVPQSVQVPSIWLLRMSVLAAVYRFQRKYRFIGYIDLQVNIPRQACKLVAKSSKGRV